LEAPLTELLQSRRQLWSFYCPASVDIKGSEDALPLLDILEDRYKPGERVRCARRRRPWQGHRVSLANGGSLKRRQEKSNALCEAY
jgi:hypothetical protein